MKALAQAQSQSQPRGSPNKETPLLKISQNKCMSIQVLAVSANDSSCAKCRSERLAKYNQLMRIEEELGAAAKFAGTKPASLP
ncbi:hypothetical protein Pelo_18266 [Pelomyxa schiedti]|nr:hypothetical protein Pelo_18266 [Pelomyxa schiedti]